MKYWTWQIPELYQSYLVELGVAEHPLFADFRKMQYIESGTLPQAFEIHPNVFLWRNYGHRMIYERMLEERLLILASIERM